MKTVAHSIKMILSLCLIAFFIAPGMANTSAPTLGLEEEPPGGLIRLKDASAGPVTAVNSLAVGNAQIVTPIRTSTGFLKVIVWKTENNGTITRKGDKTAYKISTQIASAHIGGGRLVTAVKDNAGNLKLTVFKTFGNGAITQQGSIGAGKVSKVSITPYTNNKVVTSLRDGSGKLRVIAWSINNAGQITRLGTYTGGPVYDVTQAYIGGYRVVTACKLPSGNLRLYTFKVNANGSVSYKGSSGNQAGVIKDLDISAITSSRVVTSVKQGNNTMKLIAWRINGDGSIDRKESSPSTGTIASLSLDKSYAAGNAHLFAGVRTSTGAMKIISYYDNGGGPSISRVADGTAGKVYNVDTTYVYEKGLIVTVVRTASGNLKLISWKFPQIP